MAARSKDHRQGEDRYDWNLARGDLVAFGETKTLSEWAKDPRCVVSRESVRTRLALGWDVERALTARKHDKTLGSFEYAGQSKTLAEWADFFGLKYHTLYRRIVTDKLSFEAAIEKGLEDNVRLVTAFGETKPVHHWAVDPRAKATGVTIIRRLNAGWNPRLAITEEPDNRSTLGQGTVYEAFGKRMSIPDWARLSGVPESKIRQRMQRVQCTVEQALLFYDWYPDWLDRYLTVEVDIDQLESGDVVMAVNHSTAKVTVRRDRLQEEA